MPAEDQVVDAAAGAQLVRPARHCAASYLIAAGVNPKELSTYLGHADIRITYNRYRHLLPGNYAATADRLTAFFEAATVKAR